MVMIVFAGVFFKPIAGVAGENPFSRFISPVTNPVYFDDPRNETFLHIVHVYQALPKHVSTILGHVPLDGDLNLTAVRLNYAINDRFSLVAAKDGYIDFNPDDTLAKEEGWGDLAAGFKYALMYNPEKEFILSGKVLAEFTQGSRDVFQGNGDGNIAPSLTFLKGLGKLQLCGTFGGIIPFDNDEESTEIYDSWHVSYAVTPKLFPLIELNHFWVVDEGDRNELVASIVKFEGGDVINLGARHAERNKHFLSLAAGLRYRMMKNLDVGFAYEFPLVDQNHGLMDERLTFDLYVHF